MKTSDQHFWETDTATYEMHAKNSERKTSKTPHPERVVMQVIWKSKL